MALDISTVLKRAFDGSEVRTIVTCIDTSGVAVFAEGNLLFRPEEVTVAAGTKPVHLATEGSPLTCYLSNAVRSIGPEQQPFDVHQTRTLDVALVDVFEPLRFRLRPQGAKALTIKTTEESGMYLGFGRALFGSGHAIYVIEFMAVSERSRVK